MAYEHSQFDRRSRKILVAAREIQASLAHDGVTKRAAVSQLLAAAEEDAVQVGFQPSTASSRIASGSRDVLSGALIDLEAANILLAAGLAVGENGPADARQLAKAIPEIESISAAAVPQGLERVRFDGCAKGTSENFAAAIAEFRSTAGSTLDEIRSGTMKVFADALETVSRVDTSHIAAAFEKLGQIGSPAATAGRLIKRGIEKLQAALRALVALVGQEALGIIKKELQRLWQSANLVNIEKQLLTGILGIPQVSKRLEACLATSSLQGTALSRGSAQLHALAERYAEHVRLLGGIMGAIGLAGTALAFIAALAQWLPLAIAGSTLAVTSATLLIGMDYVGAHRLLGWSNDSVQSILDRLTGGAGA